VCFFLTVGDVIIFTSWGSTVLLFSACFSADNLDNFPGKESGNFFHPGSGNPCHDSAVFVEFLLDVSGVAAVERSCTSHVVCFAQVFCEGYGTMTTKSMYKYVCYATNRPNTKTFCF